jgi:hypothetical protein
MNILPLFLLTKGDFSIQHFSQSELPYKPLFLDDLTSEVGRLTHFVDYIILVDLWMEEVCGSMNQPWHSLGFILDQYDIAWLPDLATVEIFLETHITFDISLFWSITKHKGRIQIVDKFLE